MPSCMDTFQVTLPRHQLYLHPSLFTLTISNLPTVVCTKNKRKKKGQKEKKTLISPQSNPKPTSFSSSSSFGWENPYQRRRISASMAMATFCSSTSSLSSQFSGLRRLCFKLDHPSPSHVLFQRQIDSHLRFSSSPRPCRGVVTMAGSGKVLSVASDLRNLWLGFK